MDTQNITEAIRPQDIAASCVTSEVGSDCAFYGKNAKINNLFRYTGENYLPGIPTRNDIVAENDEGLTEILENALINRQNIPFMPVDIEESNEYINQTPHYVLRLYGPLINGQKAVVTITGIKVFFDICVPDNKDARFFESEIKTIFANKKDEEKTVDVSKIRIEHIKAFPICGYHMEKKSYLRVFTPNTFQRKIALNIIRNYKSEKQSSLILETASDDRSAYYRKVAREYGISLSGWGMISNYNYDKCCPLCSYAFRVSINNFQPMEDSLNIRNLFPTSAITHDRTLVLTWDIETHTERGLDQLPRPWYLEDTVFMICMTIHWKNDPKPLKQICLADVETASDPNWITIICENQTNLLKAFALCWRALAPDIVIGFNDSDYNWPFIVEKAKQLNILDWMWLQMSANTQKSTAEQILRWNYYGKIGKHLAPKRHSSSIKEKTCEDSPSEEAFASEEEGFSQREIKIKIGLEEFFISSFLKLPGCVPIDVRASFKKIYPRS